MRLKFHEVSKKVCVSDIRSLKRLLRFLHHGASVHVIYDALVVSKSLCLTYFPRVNEIKLSLEIFSCAQNVLVHTVSTLVAMSSEALSNRERTRPLGRAAAPSRRRHLDLLFWNCLQKDKNNSWTWQSVDDFRLQWFHVSTSYPHMITVRCTQCIIQHLLFFSRVNLDDVQKWRADLREVGYRVSTRHFVRIALTIFRSRFPMSCLMSFLCIWSRLSTLSFFVALRHDDYDRWQRRRPSSSLTSNTTQDADRDMTWWIQTSSRSLLLLECPEAIETDWEEVRSKIFLTWKMTTSSWNVEKRTLTCVQTSRISCKLNTN